MINTGHTATFRSECAAQEAFYVLTVHSTTDSIMFETKKRRIQNWQGGPGPPSLGEHKRRRPLLSLSGIHKDYTGVWPHLYHEFMKPVQQYQNYNGEVRRHTNSNFKLL